MLLVIVSERSSGLSGQPCRKNERHTRDRNRRVVSDERVMVNRRVNYPGTCTQGKCEGRRMKCDSSFILLHSAFILTLSAVFERRPPGWPDLPSCSPGQCPPASVRPVARTTLCGRIPTGCRRQPCPHTPARRRRQSSSSCRRGRGRPRR